ncbi:hypothetical protein ACQGRZ_27975 [Bacillus wiedmannii]|uniref:hypothetical protein n=1 Tax=Bacillus wiedmannii TaxID=1890302 RepID=UPI003CF13DB0
MIRDDVNETAIIAAVITTLTAIWTNPDATLPIFKEVFYACLISKNVEWAKEIGMGFRKKSRFLD